MEYLFETLWYPEHKRYESCLASHLVSTLFSLLLVLVMMTSFCWTESMVQTSEEVEDVAASIEGEMVNTVEAGNQEVPGMLNQLLRKLATLLA